MALDAALAVVLSNAGTPAVGLVSCRKPQVPSTLSASLHDDRMNLVIFQLLLYLRLILLQVWVAFSDLFGVT